MINKNLKNNFSAIQKLLLSYPQIKEIENAKQISYHDENGVIVMMRQKGEKLLISFGKGALLQEKFPNLLGEGKVVRHIYFGTNDTVDTTLLKEMIDESIILGIEAHERKVLKRALKNTTFLTYILFCYF